VDLTLFPRNGSRLDYFKAFLPADAIELLRKSIDDRYLLGATAPMRRDFRSIKTKEMWRWIAQRLDITINFNIDIDAAYKSVRLLFYNDSCLC
jgi:hypothetical protein